MCLDAKTGEQPEVSVPSQPQPQSSPPPPTPPQKSQQEFLSEVAGLIAKLYETVLRLEECADRIDKSAGGK